MISRFKAGGKVLDIGQGTGELLNYLKMKGWEVTGIEPNESARKFASENYGIAVYDEAELDRLGKKSFDLIQLWHVLEHVQDLGERMQQIRKLIKDDGVLIIAVPNLDSPDFRFYGEKWAALDVPRHLYHFTSGTMSILLEKWGFKLVKEFPLKMDAYYISLLSEKYNNNKIPHLKAFLNGYRSNRIASKDNAYSSTVFVAQPK